MARDPVNETLRTFLALPLAENFQSKIESCTKALKPCANGIKWVAPEQVHVTLHFFGETSPDELRTIQDQVASVTQHYSALKLGLEGIGFFPNPAKPRVIWIGVSGDVAQLAQMQREIEHNLKGSGFTVEDRGFKAHATIGRVKRQGPEIQKLVQKIENQKAAGLKTELRIFEQLVLFKSLLTPQGPHYEVVQTFHLSSKP